MAAEVMDFDCEMNPTEFSEESELEIEMESGESLDSDGALESRIIQPIVASVTSQVLSFTFSKSKRLQTNRKITN